MHALILSLEPIKNCAQEFLKYFNPPDKNYKAPEKIDRPRIDYLNKIAFINQLIANNVHHNDKELAQMLTHVSTLLANIGKFYELLPAGAATQKNDKLIENLTQTIQLYELVSNKLVEAIELSSLIVEFPIATIPQNLMRYSSSKATVAKQQAIPHGMASEATQLTVDGTSNPVPVKNDSQTTKGKGSADTKISTAYPLHDAARQSTRAALMTLAKDKQKNRDIDQLNDQGLSPLHIAILNHNRTTCSTLIMDLGADVDLPSSIKWTPLHYAADTGQADIVRALLTRNANCNADTGQKFWTENSPSDYLSPLILAIKRGNSEIAELLIKQGARINRSWLWYPEETPLYIAAKEGHLDIVNLLLKHGAVVDDHYAPLLVAAENGHEEVVKKLIENNANVNYDPVGYGEQCIRFCRQILYGKLQ